MNSLKHLCINYLNCVSQHSCMEDEAYNDAIGYDEEDVDVEDDGDISVIGLQPPLPIPRSVSAQLSKFVSEDQNVVGF